MAFEQVPRDRPRRDQEALAGGKESPRVSAVKLLADIDAFRKDGDEEAAPPRCARQAPRRGRISLVSWPGAPPFTSRTEHGLA